MTPRAKTIADLIAARNRIDERLSRMGYDLDQLPTEAPVASIAIERAADYARRLIWSGHTHAEVGEMLHIDPRAIAGLIAPRGLHDTAPTNRKSAAA